MNRKLKGLKSQLAVLERHADDLKLQVANIQRTYSSKLTTISKVKAEIRVIEEDSFIKITDHAIVRYLERVKGLDINKIREEIISEHIIQCVQTLGGNGSYPNVEGNFHVKMKDNTIITVIK